MSGRDFEAQAQELLERPLSYPGLVPHKRAVVLLRIWRYCTFRPWCSWSVLRVQEKLFLRRVIWDRRYWSAIQPVTYGCEALLPPAAYQALASQLAAITISPFLTLDPGGRDGVTHGIETGNDMLSARIAWHELPDESWQPLQDWHERAQALFEALLPEATAGRHGTT